MVTGEGIKFFYSLPNFDDKRVTFELVHCSANFSLFMLLPMLFIFKTLLIL